MEQLTRRGARQRLLRCFHYSRAWQCLALDNAIAQLGIADRSLAESISTVQVHNLHVRDSRKRIAFEVKNDVTISGTISRFQ